jgi:hypothetical protein
MAAMAAVLSFHRRSYGINAFLMMIFEISGQPLRTFLSEDRGIDTFIVK